MIRVTVELISAVDPSRSTTLAMMDIANDGSESLKNPNFGSYVGATYKGRDRQKLEQRQTSKRGAVDHWPRQQFHVWNLVARMLESMGYDNGRSTPDPLAATVTALKRIRSIVENDADWPGDDIIDEVNGALQTALGGGTPDADDSGRRR